MVSVAVATLIGGNPAIAQQAIAPAQQAAAPAQPSAAPAKPGAAPADEVASVLIIGTRASQQSAIDRKKHAATAVDSIVAEDIGAFPDRNVAEAISRVAGVAYGRGEFGEGGEIGIRGGTADELRIEIDGMGVQSAGGSNGTSVDGRSADLRELSSDMIKSVDVVKGSTADMTEGSLGGGVIIQTRTGFDFKKPFYSLRASASRNSLNKQISPDFNLVLSNKFLNDRLGILLNVTKSTIHNESHQFNSAGTSNNAGYNRLVDFDNSPEKTYTHNPDVLSSTLASAINPLTNGSAPNTATGKTPYDVLRLSAAAKSKAECLTTFPNLTAADFPATGNQTNAYKNSAIQLRTAEQITCLNQWNDYAPVLMRQFAKRQDDERQGADLRFDFKVNNKLSLFTRLARNKLNRRETNSTLNFGNISYPQDVSSVNYVDNGTAFTRTAVPGTGYYTFPGLTARSNTGSGVLTSAQPLTGIVINVDPSSVVVDANHHVTAFALGTGGSFGVEETVNFQRTASEYFQTGGAYKDGGLKIDFMASKSRSEFSRQEWRYGAGQSLGVQYNKADETGLFTTTFAQAYDPNNAAAYMPPVVAATAAINAVPATATTPGSPAYSIAQQPKTSGNRQLNEQTKRINESYENQFKFDLAYNVNERIPFMTRFKTGLQVRDAKFASWSGAGAVFSPAIGTAGTPGFIPAVVIPGARLSSTNYRVCEDTPGSLGVGGLPCKYGIIPSSTDGSNLNATVVVTPGQFQDILTQSLTVQKNGQFYEGAKDRPALLSNGWTTWDIEKFFALSGVKGFDLNCVKTCMSTDGVMREQPVGRLSERIAAGYVSADFDVDRLPFSNRPLPFGMELTGNMGYRYVKTNVQGTGALDFSTRIITDRQAYNDAVALIGGNPTGTTTGTTLYKFKRNTTLDAKATDFMPIYNVGLWVLPSKLLLRYSHAKTIVRPVASRLLPSISCTFDERVADAGTLDDDGSADDQNCSGNVGNPNLKAQSNINQNLSLEWYPNKDTSFSFTVFKQEGRVGAPNKSTKVENQKVFAGTGALDPATGRSLEDVEFSYSIWDNQDPRTRRGVEFSAKTAFDFLPWIFRYTGLDATYSKARSEGTSLTRDLITGDTLPPAGEPKYTFNTSLWYDDGAFQARLALQVVAPKFACINPCQNLSTTNTTTNFNYPADNVLNVRFPYNPGLPMFSRPSRYIDGKISYKFKSGMEVFLEGRNLDKRRAGNTNGDYGKYASGAPNPLNDYYAGTRIMAGVVFRSRER